ncbi:MAG: hypothetical protein HOO96_32325 [Polyangiaceae bacterium]|nr:hypothetical protein [Polyangiaceae bacterium]
MRPSLSPPEARASLRLLRAPLASLALVAAVVGSNASCRTFAGWGSFNEAACPGENFSLTDAFIGTFDYAELREGHQDGKFKVVIKSGELCKGAKNKQTCEAQVAEAKATQGWSNGSGGRMEGFMYLVATKDDGVTVVDQRSTTTGQALSPIDTPAKAAAVASVTYGIAPDCKNSVRKVGSAYEVHLKSESCFGPREEIVRVFTAGNMELVKEERGSASCVGALESRPAKTGRGS